MKFQLSREKFETLEADAKHSGAIKEMHEADDHSGTITTADVTLSYNYDAARQELNFEVGARHSLAAHMASDNVIYNHVVKVLSSLAAAPTPANNRGTLQAPVPVTSGNLQQQIPNRLVPKPLVPASKPVPAVPVDQIQSDIHVPNTNTDEKKAG